MKCLLVKVMYKCIIELSFQYRSKIDTVEITFGDSQLSEDSMDKPAFVCGLPKYPVASAFTITSKIV